MFKVNPLYEKYNLQHMWSILTSPWIFELFEFNTLKILKNFDNGKNILSLYYKIRFILTKKPVAPIIQYVVTTKCSMNCKHCNTFIPYFNKATHQKPTTFLEFKNDIDKILKAVDHIFILGFVGGEPLLAKDLPKMIKYALQQSKIKYVFLATNCTVPLSSELIEAMKNKKFAVQISDYRNVKNIKGDIPILYDEYHKILTENNIKVSAYQEKRNSCTWHTMPKIYKDRQQEDVLLNMYSRCWGLYCNMLCGGIFTQCTISVYISRCLELSDGIKNEIIDIRTQKDSKMLTEQFINFYSKPYSAFCDYCHLEDMVYNLPCGEQVTEEKSNPIKPNE